MEINIRQLLLIAVAAGLSSCGEPKEKESSNGDQGRSLEPVEGKIESRPLPKRAARAVDATLFQKLDSEHTGIDFGFYWDDPAAHVKEFLFPVHQKERDRQVSGRGRGLYGQSGITVGGCGGGLGCRVGMRDCWYFPVIYLLL